MARIVTSDTGPLIALAKIDHLSLLTSLFDEVLIPPAVAQELMAKPGPETTLLSHMLGTSLRVSELPDQSQFTRSAFESLDVGESEAISLAYELGIPLIIDEFEGRKVARRLRIEIWGTVAVLLRAKEIGALALVAPELNKLREHGYWLSDTLIRNAIQLAGESATPDATS